MTLVDDRAERAVLAALLVRPSCWPDVAAQLEPDAFGGATTRAIADAYWAVRRRGDADADMITVSAELDRRGTMRQAGGLLGELCNEFVATTPLKHARRLRELAAARRTHELLGDIRDEQRAAEDDPVAWLEDVARRVSAATDIRRESELVHISSAIEPHLAEIGARSAGPGRGTPTGLAQLDALTGGLHDSEYIVVAARPSCGKSALGLQIATHVARVAGQPVALFSSEMKRIPVMDRLIAERADVGMHRLREGRLTEDEMRAVIGAYTELQRSGVWISDRRGWRVNEIVAQVRAWKRQHCAVRPDGSRPRPLVVVDYLQRVHASRRHSTREQEVAEISDTFATAAGELECCFMVLAQLGREVEKRAADQPPQLSDLRESGAIEQDADSVWFVHRPDRIDPAIEAGATMLSVAKQRQGECAIVPLWFRGSRQRFVHRDRDYERRTAPKTTKAGDHMPKRGAT